MVLVKLSVRIKGFIAVCLVTVGYTYLKNKNHKPEIKK